MAKSKSGLRKPLKLRMYVWVSALLIFLIYNVSVYDRFKQNNETLENTVNLLQQQLLEKESHYTQNNNQIEPLEQELAELSLVEDKLAESKQLFFANAKRYEDLVALGKGSKKIAYLTFDDGPYLLTTSFLDVLDEYDVLATFFVLGKSSDQYDAIYKRIADSDHTIGNHTYSHAIRNGIYISADAFINDVKKLEQLVHEKTALKTNIVRFPGGTPTASPALRQRIIERLREIDYGYINWNASAGDADGGRKSATDIYNNVMRTVGSKNITVVLMHDFSYSTLAALPNIIEELKARDYIFLPLFYESRMVLK